LLFEVHDKPEGAVLEGCVGRAYDHSVPVEKLISRQDLKMGFRGVSYQVITLSATGEADTPAGGSVCMRCRCQFCSCDTVEDERHKP
jgi:hypothetical protein